MTYSLFLGDAEILAEASRVQLTKVSKHMPIDWCVCVNHVFVNTITQPIVVYLYAW